MGNYKSIKPDKTERKETKRRTLNKINIIPENEYDTLIIKKQYMKYKNNIENYGTIKSSIRYFDSIDEKVVFSEF